MGIPSKPAIHVNRSRSYCRKLTYGTIPDRYGMNQFDGFLRSACYVPDGTMLLSHKVFVHSTLQHSQEGIEKAVSV